MENGVEFTAGAKDQISRSSCGRRKPKLCRCRLSVRAAAHNNETTPSDSFPPSTPPNYQQFSAPSSQWRFSYPPSTLGNCYDEVNVVCIVHTPILCCVLVLYSVCTIIMGYALNAILYRCFRILLLVTYPTI